MNEVLDKRGAEQFREAHPEYYASPVNTAKMLGWVKEHGGCISLKNLEVALSVLSADGELEKRPEITDYKVTKVPLTAYDKGVQKMHSGLVLRYNTGGIAENQLAGERPERMAELLGDTIAEREAEDSENRKLAGKVGQPVSQKLRVKYHQSLGANQRSNPDNPYQKQWAEARAVVGLNFPHLKAGSHAFNRKVSELLKKQ
jgi:hypothetical protein